MGKVAMHHDYKLQEKLDAHPIGIHRRAEKAFTSIRSVNEHSAPSVRALKIFDITQVTATKTLQFRHAVLGPG
jgi:hypothetical protein